MSHKALYQCVLWAGSAAAHGRLGWAFQLHVSIWLAGTGDREVDLMWPLPVDEQFMEGEFDKAFSFLIPVVGLSAPTVTFFVVNLFGR